MSLDTEARYQVAEMIRNFHDTEVMPLHRENINRLGGVETALHTLIERSKERKLASDEFHLAATETDKRKTDKQNLLLAMMTFMVLLLTLLVAYAAYRYSINPRVGTVIGADPTITAHN